MMRSAPLWLGGLLAIAAPPAAALIPPPPNQTSVDCNAKIYAVDTIVCENPDLLGMDQAVQRAVADVGPEPAESATYEAHETWFRRRGLCAMIETARECLAAAYSERLAVLTAMRAAPEGKVADITCIPMPWEGGARARITPEWITLSDRSGLIRGVAVPMTTTGWRPMLGIATSSARKLELRTATGLMRCRRMRGPG
ncbi:MAG: hypothetical protein JHD35_00740 [Sphingopyxis sp.]|nr:hypothetical protein [Sphingopyxis sp.]